LAVISEYSGACLRRPARSHADPSRTVDTRVDTDNAGACIWPRRRVSSVERTIRKRAEKRAE
jgi:hypothetical protein